MQGINGVTLYDLADNMFDLLRTGSYFQSLYAAGCDDNNSGITDDTLYAIAFFVPRLTTWDRIGIHVVTAGAGLTKGRLGIYRNGTNGYPGALLEDCGEIDVDNANTLENLAISQQLPAGLYWLALISDGQPTVAYSQQYWAISPGAVTDLSTFSICWTVAQAYGALPDPFTGGGTALIWMPRICLRLLSLF